MATRGQEVKRPVETRLSFNFKLDQAVTVTWRK